MERSAIASLDRWSGRSRAAVRRWPLWAVGAATIVLALAAVAYARHRARTIVRAVAPAPQFEGRDVRAPAGVRIKVEVLNATRTRGLGRRATLYLRDHGFDVVTVGTAPESRDTTLVIDRSAHPQWAQLVARALGAARAASQPDSSRYVDVSVLVGASWHPPPQPFYP